jgi:uncharacterized protein (DUF2384 family)
MAGDIGLKVVVQREKARRILSENAQTLKRKRPQALFTKACGRFDASDYIGQLESDM